MRPHIGLLELVAWRGNAGEFPENTLPALDSALELGVRCLAVDVQLSADGVPMLIHDHELGRISAGEGSVLEKNSSELVRLDVGESGRFGPRFRGVCMPRLADALGVLENRPQARLFVEMGRQSLARFGQELVLARLVETLRPFRSQVVVTSRDLGALMRARHPGGFQIGWCLPAYDDHSRLKYEALQPEYLLCELAQLPRGGTLWRGPWKWVIQGVTSFEQAQALVARGVTFVGTREVRALVAALRAAPH